MKNTGMPPIEHDDTPNAQLPEELRRSLHSLRQDAMPGHELWPGIAARIATGATAPPPLRTGVGHARRPRRLARFAVAASLAAAVALAWQLLPQPASSPDDPVAGLMLHEARVMTREYQAAWTPLDARRHPAMDASALQEIDRSAAEVRAALRQDPSARFLFDRLQSLYARRLDLSRRFASNSISAT
jgi:hypothetical protein